MSYYNLVTNNLTFRGVGLCFPWPQISILSFQKNVELSIIFFFQFKQNILVDNYRVGLLLLFSFFPHFSDQCIISLKLATEIKKNT
jgi:hypothetical protein